ncbi:regulatory protein RecX [Phytohalomonas tamaricis]|uniref:regulatory protein RecX n=1 Tax=Phytohalomonas tamaricis TaxID=2081032 RepID=UPI000D0BC4EF|nr:regulatory protein RecX [Phytohalomonas tamaricis]
MSAEERNPRDDAIRLLARREYARAELNERLAKRGHEPDIIALTLDALVAEGLQSDERFVEHFVRSRVNRLQGPRKIHAELRGRGLDDALVREGLGAADADWFELAAQALSRRFDSPADHPRERAKQARFLASRGFDGEHARYAMSSAWSSPQDL